MKRMIRASKTNTSDAIYRLAEVCAMRSGVNDPDLYLENYCYTDGSNYFATLIEQDTIALDREDLDNLPLDLDNQKLMEYVMDRYSGYAGGPGNHMSRRFASLLDKYGRTDDYLEDYGDPDWRDAYDEYEWYR